MIRACLQSARFPPHRRDFGDYWPLRTAGIIQAGVLGPRFAHILQQSRGMVRVLPMVARGAMRMFPDITVISYSKMPYMR